MIQIPKPILTMKLLMGIRRLVNWQKFSTARWLSPRAILTLKTRTNSETCKNMPKVGPRTLQRKGQRSVRARNFQSPKRKVSFWRSWNIRKVKFWWLKAQTSMKPRIIITSSRSWSLISTLHQSFPTVTHKWRPPAHAKKIFSYRWTHPRPRPCPIGQFQRLKFRTRLGPARTHLRTPYTTYFGRTFQ